MNKRLIFFGTEEFSSSSLTTLIKSGYEIVAVVTKPDTTRHRGLKLQSPAVMDIAKKAKLEVFQPVNLLDIAPNLDKLKADAGILVSYGKLIPQSVIDLFPGGIINVHPSLLPLYRGPSPIESAILNGDSQTGVSLMSLTSEMDEGPIYAQSVVKLDGTETKPILYKKLAKIGADMLQEYLPDILSGSLKPVSQNNLKATATRLLKKEDGLVDQTKPAIIIEREIRAYLDWPKSQTTLNGHRVIVTKARIATSQMDGDLVIKCQPGWLEIQQLIAPSGRQISGAEFLRGYAI